MGCYKVSISRQADKDIRAHLKSGNKAIFKRINQILDELSEHPATGIGQPEQLKHQLSGFWSRRISSEHRIIYRIDDELVEVFVVSATGHYK